MQSYYWAGMLHTRTGVPYSSWVVGAYQIQDIQWYKNWRLLYYIYLHIFIEFCYIFCQEIHVSISFHICQDRIFCKIIIMTDPRNCDRIVTVLLLWKWNTFAVTLHSKTLSAKPQMNQLFSSSTSEVTTSMHQISCLHILYLKWDPGT